MQRREISRSAILITIGYLAVWLVAAVTWKYFDRVGGTLGRILPYAYWTVFSLSWPVGIFWIVTCRSRAGAVIRRMVASVAFVLWWQWSVFATDALDWAATRATLAVWGTAALFFLGLFWVIWAVERAARRHERQPSQPRRIWNPLNPDAWYYGRRSKRLHQSLASLVTYSFLFMGAYLVLTQVGGCQESYEMPPGGGEQQPIAQQIKVQKKIRKKYVINPLSAIKFKVPPIEETVVITQDLTKHAYKVGYGKGEGSGFGGKGDGKVRFIRLEYTGGDWDQDFGVGADLNMLIEYNVRTGTRVHDKTESRRVAELKNFPPKKAPPMVYMTGQKNISLSKSEIKILREYLLDKHGMLFVDNGGSRNFHRHAIAMMHQVLPNIKEVPIPLDDVIHRVPYTLPFLPYVAIHGDRPEALGWKVDGRWVCYYHPGDIADAWADDHAGVKPEVWEACYRLGCNVISYSHAEHAKWREAQSQE